MQDFWAPRRIVMAAIGVLIVVWCATALNWTWLADPKYQALILRGIWNTIWLLVVTMVLGMLLAIPLGFALAAGCRLLRADPRHTASVAALAFVLWAWVAVPVDPLDPGVRPLADFATGLALCGAGPDPVGRGLFGRGYARGLPGRGAWSA